VSGFLGVAFSLAAFAQNVRIPGTSVTIAPPPGFSVSRSFAGLEHAENGSKVSFREMPVTAYSGLAEIFSSPRTASQTYRSENTRIMRIDQLDVNGKRVPLAIGDQAAGRRTVTKYMALLGGGEDNTNTLLVTFDVTDPATLSRRDVEATIRSITLGRLATVDDKLATLPYTFAAVPPFRVVDVLPNGTAMLTSYEGSDPTGMLPRAAIERGSAGVSPAETAQLAETLLRDGARGTVEILERSTVPFVGGDGQYLSATVGDGAVRQFVRVLPGGRYVRLVAFGGTTALDEVQPAIEQLAASVQLK
jgi:hypothetical protein